MVATYNIAGRQVGSHILAIATLTTLFGGSAFAMRGGDKAKTNLPPINASNDDEEKFIKEFIQQADMDNLKESAQKAKH